MNVQTKCVYVIQSQIKRTQNHRNQQSRLTRLIKQSTRDAFHDVRRTKYFAAVWLHAYTIMFVVRMASWPVVRELGPGVGRDRVVGGRLGWRLTVGLAVALEVQLTKQGRVQQRGLLLLMQMGFIGHVGLLVDRDGPGHGEEGVQERVGGLAGVDGIAEGLDEP